MLKIVLIVAAAIVALVLAVTLVGALLPTGHTASASITLHQPVDSVWQVVRELQGYPSWWPDAASVERDSQSADEVWIMRDKHNQGLPLLVVESSSPHRLVTRIADPNLPFGGTWTYTLESIPSGCSVTVTEDGQVTNPIFRFVSRFIIGHYHTIESYLKALAARFGEDVAPSRIA